MASQSKIATESMKDILLDMFVGTTKKKMVSGAILLIIAFLIHVQTMGGKDQYKFKPRDKDYKKVTIKTISERRKRKCRCSFLFED